MPQNLLLIPGLTCTAALWVPQISGLAQQADITIADHSRHASMQAIAASILADAPPRFALAGLSMGGYIAFEIMRQAPERVTRLALLDTGAKPFDASQTAARQALIDLANRDGMAAVLEKLTPIFIHPDRLGDTTLRATITQMGRDTGATVFARQQAAIMSRPDSRPTLPQIRCPTLVLVGQQDLLTPVAEHELIAAGIPGAKLTIISDCGHLSTLEQPAAVNAALLAWLASPL
jgi:pimeloyl-ACP methyl ester carboxylesterase